MSHSAVMRKSKFGYIGGTLIKVRQSRGKTEHQDGAPEPVETTRQTPSLLAGRDEDIVRSYRRR